MCAILWTQIYFGVENIEDFIPDPSAVIDYKS